MKIVITGQRAFGRAVLKRLIEDGHEVLGVAVAPQQMRKDKMDGLAMRYNIPILTDAEKLTSADIPDGTELVISAHSHWIVSQQIIGKAKYGAIGFHPSLLPLHRGRDAVRWAIKMGDKVTGGTVFYLNDRADGGDVIERRMVFIRPEWDYHDLWNEIFPIGVDMVSDAVASIEANDGNIPAEKQDEKLATWEPSFERQRLRRNELIMLH